MTPAHDHDGHCSWYTRLWRGRIVRELRCECGKVVQIARGERYECTPNLPTGDGSAWEMLRAS